MPLFTTLVEDTSPLLKFSPQWMPGSSDSDPSADKYTEGTFTMTNSRGASLSFQFYGSSVSIYGATRTNHGRYHVQVDNTTFPSVSGIATQDLFNQTLFTSKVEPGLHTVTLTNDDNAFLDVDYVTFDTTIGQASEPTVINTFSSAHPSFVYSPTSAWSAPTSPGTFVGGYGRSSSDASAVANFTFSGTISLSAALAKFLTQLLGSAVALYGPVGPRNARSFSIQIDNKPVNTFSALYKNYRPRQILFFDGHLDSGPHTLLIKPQAGGGQLEIDFAAVNSAPSLGGSYGLGAVLQSSPGAQTTPSPSPEQTAIGATNQSSHGLVAGLAVTTTAAALALISLFILFLRYRKVVRRLQAVTPSRESPVKDIDFVPSYVQPFTLTSSSAPYRTTSRGTSLPNLRQQPFETHVDDVSGSASVEGWSEVYHPPGSSVNGGSEYARFTHLTPQRPASWAQKDIGYQKSSNGHDLKETDSSGSEEAAPPPKYCITRLISG